MLHLESLSSHRHPVSSLYAVGDYYIGLLTLHPTQPLSSPIQADWDENEQQRSWDWI